MQVETKYLRLRQPVALGVEIDGWRVCWLGGWCKNRLFYFVMGMRVTPRAHSNAARRNTDAHPKG